MDIVFLTTEVVPFAKTGGLADVCGTLPAKLADRGHRVAVIMPAFRQIYDVSGCPIHPTDISFPITLDAPPISCRLMVSHLPDSNVPVYFVDQPQYFDRPGLYGDFQGDYPDNCARFTFFCRAAIQAITQLGWSVDVVHCNDWQTGLVPAYIATEFESHRWMQNASTIMTIHNMAYQGCFWHYDFPMTGLGWERFNSEEMEFYGQLNFLKTGIVYADTVSTVSPKYAQEIQTPDHGCGLDGVLRRNGDRLVGITNGIDSQVWNPATDPHLKQPYDRNNWRIGKRANRLSLRQQFGLEMELDQPLIGLIGRLAEQKGWNLVLQVMERYLEANLPVQWIVLGTGNPQYHHRLQILADRFPSQLGIHLGFSDSLAHQIEAGSDMFLMPSQYEPCGLNQLYSLRYGAVPIVNPTGGLADTVLPFGDGYGQNETATGFHMPAFNVDSLQQVIDQAVNLYAHYPDCWAQLVENGMQQDWSWGQSAIRYERLYGEAISHKRKIQEALPNRTEKS